MSKKITFEDIEIFEYLNKLRESGATNMFGARPYIEREYGLNKQEAGRVLSLWMTNFNEDGYEDLLAKLL